MSIISDGVNHLFETHGLELIEFDAQLLCYFLSIHLQGCSFVTLHIGTGGLYGSLASLGHLLSQF